MNQRQVKKIIFILLFALFTVAAVNDSGEAASKGVIDAKVSDAMKRFHSEISGSSELAGKSHGILVFPSVLKAGIGVGGEYGEGALRIKGKTVDYYNTAAASIGFQLGAQSKTVMILFMTKESLDAFRYSEGWEVGVDGSVALIKVGAGGSIDTTNIKAPVVGFVFGNKGLMYNLTLEGSKITKLKK